MVMMGGGGGVQHQHGGRARSRILPDKNRFYKKKQRESIDHILIKFSTISFWAHFGYKPFAVAKNRKIKKKKKKGWETNIYCAHSSILPFHSVTAYRESWNSLLLKEPYLEKSLFHLFNIPFCITDMSINVSSMKKKQLARFQVGLALSVLLRWNEPFGFCPTFYVPSRADCHRNAPVWLRRHYS